MSPRQIRPIARPMAANPMAQNNFNPLGNYSHTQKQYQLNQYPSQNQLNLNIQEFKTRFTQYQSSATKPGSSTLNPNAPNFTSTGSSGVSTPGSLPHKPPGTPPAYPPFAPPQIQTRDKI